MAGESIRAVSDFGEKAEDLHFRVHGSSLAKAPPKLGSCIVSADGKNPPKPPNAYTYIIYIYMYTCMYISVCIYIYACTDMYV